MDYYAVLQVHPDAEQEVIDAAYRQLMRKYHPDVAGADGGRAHLLHERAKLINQAYAVLRDPDLRWLYDRSHGTPVTVGARAEPYARAQAGAATSPGYAQAHYAPQTSQPAAATAGALVLEEPSPLWMAPVRAIAAGYYLLPGPYEWEPGSARELLAALLILPLGVTTWLLLSGRLNALLEHVPFGVLGVCAALVLGTLLAGRDLPRLVLAAAPSLLQFSGALDGPLRSAHLPTWVAAGGLALLSLLVSARLYVFAVLPTLGICWALSQLLARS
jgi:DnaJ domain